VLISKRSALIASSATILLTAKLVLSSDVNSYTDWPAYGGGTNQIRYSKLTQINRSNVKQLQVAWTFDTGDAFKGSEFQCNPLVIHGVLYATTPKVNVVALDAATGALLWRFDPNPGGRVVSKMRNRGLNYWSSGDQTRIFFAYRQYLISLDAHTGKIDEAFGDHGRVDLRDDLGRNPRNMVSMTSPGIVYKDLLIVGSIISETLPASPGDIRAYDVRTGKLRWIFHTIPHPGEFGYETWPKDAWTYSGAANNWTGMALDEKRGVVFAPTGSASFDFYGANRVGDDLFANCLLALDAQTGKRLWHFQAVHHDIWDRDFPSPPSLVTVKHRGKSVEAVAQTTKSGYVLLFDRSSGKPLFPIEERPVPASEVPGEVTAKTQPFPLMPEPFARQRLTEDMITDRNPQVHEAAVAQFRSVQSAGQFIPGSMQGTVVFPGFDGGAEWGGSAFDPETGLLYVNANEMAWILRLVEQHPETSGTVSGKELYVNNCAVCHKADLSGGMPEFPALKNLSDRMSDSDVMMLLYQGSGRMPSFAQLGRAAIRAITDYVLNGENTTAVQAQQNPQIVMRYLNDGYNRFLDSEGYPAIKPPWGTLNAIDLDTGKYAWKIPFGEYPALAAQGLKNTGSENYGGPVVTAGGLVFIGATSYDKKFHVFDKKTGELLWETTLPAAGNATPATYAVNGRQFVVISAGGGKSTDPSGGSIVAFALPQ
jgi:quinoprotein glucose dehydrogenase